jgi:hypothetical protein
LLDLAKADPSQEVRSAALTTLGRYIYEGEAADYDFDWGSMEELVRASELPREDFERVRDFLKAVYTGMADWSDLDWDDEDEWDDLGSVRWN